MIFILFSKLNFKIREEDEENEAEGANYQLEMMKCLREVNVDNNTVGWYVFFFFPFFVCLVCAY